MSDKRNIDMPTADQVLAFIAANPAFLQANGLAAGVRDDKIVDIAPAIARRAQTEARTMRNANKTLRHVAAANMVSWQKLHHATLALLASTDVASLVDVVTQDFPAIFDLTGCVLIVDGPGILAADTGFITSNQDEIEAASEGRSLFLGAPNQAAQRLYGDTAPSIAMIRLPDQLDAPVSHCLILLAGRDADSFTPDLGSELLVLLAEMIGVALAARVEAASIAGAP